MRGCFISATLRHPLDILWRPVGGSGVYMPEAQSQVQRGSGGLGHVAIQIFSRYLLFTATRLDGITWDVISGQKAKKPGNQCWLLQHLEVREKKGTGHSARREALRRS